MQKDYARKGLALIAVSYEPASKVAPFVKKNKINYIVGGDAKDTLDAYGVRGFPTIVVIDAKGKVVWTGHSGEEAEGVVVKELEKSPVKGGGLAAKSGKKALAAAHRLLKDKKYVEAYRAFERLAKDFADTTTGGKARKQMDAMRADPQIMKVVRDSQAAKKCENWLDIARGLAGSGRHEKAREYYRRVIDEYPDTTFAETARHELDQLAE